MELLLLSNSRTPNGFLTDYGPAIAPFVSGLRRAVFVPFAAVRRSWDDYTAAVAEAFAVHGVSVASLHDSPDAAQALAAAQLLIVGGGNTFRLLQQCRQRHLMEPLLRQIKRGGRYLGWSAGANLACPTIKTTNDMPVIDPGGFDALGLIGFQINPHYTNAAPPGHQGETREQRLLEYAILNPDTPVLGLPEGDWIRVSGNAVELHGPHPATLFSGGDLPLPTTPGPLNLS
jgi:dipeptidase E